MRRLVRRLWRDRRGVSALELALFMPLILALLVGLLEFGRLILVTQKLQNGAFILADLTARDRVLREGELANIFLAVDELIKPFDFATRGTALVSSVVAPPTGRPTVRWQRKGVGPLAASSAIGVQGAVAVLPGGLTLMPGDTVIVAEMVFDYRPIFAITPLGTTIRKQAFYKPRLGTLDTLLP